MADDDLLVSDAERDDAIAELRAHLADGRLTTEEFGARVDAVYAARTRAALAEALRQLPARVETPPPRPSLVSLAARQAGYSALTVTVCVLVWAFTGADGNFWPKWVILVAAIGLVTRVGKAALGDEEARAELERKVGAGPPSPPGPPQLPRL